MNYRGPNHEEVRAKILSFTAQLELGPSCRFDGLAVFPLFGSNFERELVYLTLEEALTWHLLEVRENEVAKPHELVAENKSDQMVLIIDGEEMVGGKQNRITNASLLLPPRTRAVLPVSCTERSRWCLARKSFRAEEAVFPSLRAIALGKGANYRADQFRIWASIRHRSALFDHQPPIDALHELYDREETSLTRCTAALRYPQGSKGVIAVIGNGLTCADLFDQAKTLAKLWPKLIRSYTIEAIAWESEMTAEEGKGERLIGALREAHFQVLPSAGLGQKVRIEGEDLVGSAIVYAGQIVHLALFSTPPPSSTMQTAGRQLPHIQLGA